MAERAGNGIRSTRRGAAFASTRSLAPALGIADADVAESFDAIYRRVDPAEGERRLMLAVLEDGIRTLVRYAGATRGRARTLQLEALSWFLSDAQSDVFAFTRICEALEIDPGRLRGRILARVRTEGPPEAQLH